MPELPEVETIMRGIRAAIEGATIASVQVARHDLRWPIPDDLPRRVGGAAVFSVRRRGKYILCDLSTGETLLLHLGMSGRIHINEDEAVHPQRADLHEHVILRTRQGARLGFVDPRRFGAVLLFETGQTVSHPLLATLGVEPLSDRLDVREMQRLLAGRRAPIKAALLDQRLIAGLGNIYVCEVLFRAGIHPARAAASVTDEEAARLTKIIPAVLQEAINAGGSSLRDYVQADGARGGFQDFHQVYGRAGEACPRCHCLDACGGIKRIVQGGRSTFFCPRCQPETLSESRRVKRA